MAFERVAQPYDMLNPPANFQVQSPRPIVRFHCVLTMTFTLVAGAAQKAVGGGIRAFIRQILWLRGGSPIQTWGTNGFIGAGGWMMDNIMRAWLKAVPQITDVPAAPPIGALTLKFAFVIPVALPNEQYAIEGQNLSAVRVKPKVNVASELWSLEFKAGTIADLFDTPGASTIDTASIEVVVETDETLNPEMPDDGIWLYSNPNPLSLPLSVGVNRPFDLPRDGLLLNQSQLAYDNSILDNDLVTELQYIFNTKEILSEMSWDMQQHLAALNADAPGNYPVGQNFIDWDVTHDLENAINTPAATAWQVKLDHIAPTGRGDLVEQMVFTLPTTIGVQRQARG